MTAHSEPLTANEANTARRRGLTLIAAAVALVAIGWGGWHWANGRHVETTDNAYVQGNVVQLQKIKGVGAKSAQRIVLELKDKMIKAVDGAEHLLVAQGNTNKDEALSALIALGFQRAQAEKAVNKVMAAEGDAAAVEQIIKLALKAL